MSSAADSPDRHAYKYRAILARTGIRLISLTSFTNGKPRCEIIHTTLESSPEYEALSYTWGDVKNLVPLCVDGDCYIMISENLFGAIEQLVDENEPRLLWIDQLCINQDDILEKNQQVEQMTRIYERASVTVIWLGEDNGQSSRLLETIRRLQQILGSPQSRQSPMTALNYSEEIFNEMGRQGMWDDIHSVSRSLLQRPWFQRAWVFQEAVVSSKTVFLLGSYYLPWDELMRVILLSMYPEEGRTSLLMPSAFQLFARMNEMRYAISDKKRIPLTLLLKEGSGVKCSNPRDLVYSLLGMVDDNREDLKVDYNLPVLTLFVKVTRHIIERHKNLAILATIEDEQMTDGLPSWTPDWTVGTFVHCMDIDSAMRKSYYNASKGYVHSAQPCRYFLHLAVNGKIVDVVQEVLDHNFDNFHNDFPFEDLVRRFPVKKVFKSLQSYLDRKSYSQPQHRTMLAAVVRCLIGGHVKSWDDLLVLHRLPPEVDIAELILDYSDHLLHSEDTGSSQYPASWKGKTFKESTELQVLTTRLGIQSNICAKRRIVFNDSYPIGLAPRKTLPGDLICILHGATVPCVLRPDGDYFKWIGNAYIDAIMQGEAVVWGEHEADTFILV